MKIFIYIFIVLFAKVSVAQLNDSVNLIASKSDFKGCEAIPEYFGGNTEMLKFIAKNMNYSKCNPDIVGCHKIFLSFVVSESGKIKDAKVIKGIEECQDANNEALRVLNLMPNWKPAFKEGKPIDFKMNLPMYITLK